MKQERDFDGRFTAEAAAVIVRLAEQSAIKGMVLGSGSLVSADKITYAKKESPINFPYNVNGGLFSARLMNFSRNISIADIIGFQSEADYKTFQQAFHHNKYPAAYDIRYPAFAVDVDSGEIYLFVSRNEAYWLKHLDCQEVEEDLHDVKKWLIVDFETAKQLLRPRKRRINRRYTWQAGAILREMFEANLITKVKLANGDIVNVEYFEDNEGLQPFRVNDIDYKNDFANTDFNHANPFDIVGIPDGTERARFKHRFNSRWRSGYPAFAKNVHDGCIRLFVETYRAIDLASGTAYWMDTPYGSKEHWQPLSYKEAWVELFGTFPYPHEIDVNPMRESLNADMGRIAMQLAQLKMLSGYFKTEDDEYLAEPVMLGSDCYHYFINQDEMTRAASDLDNGRFAIAGDHVKFLTNEVDNMLLSKCYYLRYGDKK